MAAGPPIMVNSCTGKMGHATAEAVLRAGLELVPFTFCGYSQGVAVGRVGVAGIPVEKVTPENRAQVGAASKAGELGRRAVVLHNFTSAGGTCRSCRMLWRSTLA